MGVTRYGFDIHFLYSLDIFSFDQLIALASETYNHGILDQATAMRYAMNADEKQWKEFVDSRTMSQAEAEKEKIKKSVKALSRMMGS